MNELQEYRQKNLENKMYKIVEYFVERTENKPSYRKEAVTFETKNGKIEGFYNFYSPSNTLARAIGDVIPKNNDTFKHEMKIDDNKKYVVIASNEYDPVKEKDMYFMQNKNNLGIKLKVFEHDSTLPLSYDMNKQEEVDEDGNPYINVEFTEEQKASMVKAVAINSLKIPGFYSFEVNGSKVILSPLTDYIFEYQQIHIINDKLLDAIQKMKEIKIEVPKVQSSKNFIQKVKEAVTKNYEKETQKLIELLDYKKEILEANRKTLINLKTPVALAGCERDIRDIDEIKNWIDNTKKVPEILDKIKQEYPCIDKLLSEESFVDKER